MTTLFNLGGQTQGAPSGTLNSGATNTSNPYGLGYDIKGNLLNPFAAGLGPINMNPTDPNAAVKTIVNGGNDGSGGTGGGLGIDGTTQNPSSASLYPMVNASDLQINSKDPSSYYAAAFAAVAPYYQKLLDEANGDLNLAMGNLKTDYETGMRYNTEDLARTTGQTLDNLNATITQLTGITFPKETEATLDTLNKRGIATTQPNAGAPVTPVSANVGGRGGTEMGMLSEDQKLRQEAVNRSAQQTLQNAGVTSQRQTEKLALDKTRGEQAAGQSYRTFAETAKHQMDTDITAKEQTAQQNDIQSQGLNVQNKILKAQYGGGSGTSTGNGPYGGYNTKNEWFKAKTGGDIAPVGWNG